MSVDARANRPVIYLAEAQWTRPIAGAVPCANRHMIHLAEAQWTRPIAGAVPRAGPKEMFDRCLCVASSTTMRHFDDSLGEAESCLTPD